MNTASLLELLHAAPTRWTTFQAVCRSWHHQTRSRQATDRLTGRSRPAEQDKKQPHEEVVQILVATGGRIRQETMSSPRSTALIVKNGEGWMLVDSSRGVLLHRGGGSHSVGTFDVGTLLDPSILIPDLQFGAITEDAIDGRPCWLVETIPRRTSIERMHSPSETWGADAIRLWIDQDRGSALRLEASFEGEPFYVLEATEVLYDTAIPDELFDLAPPDGVTVFDTSDEPALQRLSIEEAADEPPFTVLIPTRLPHEMDIEMSYEPGGGFAATRPAVIVNARDDRRSRGVVIHQTRTEDATKDLLEWREVRRAGQVYLVYDHDGDRAVRLDRDGTHARLTGPFELDVLLDIAESLQPIGGVTPDETA